MCLIVWVSDHLENLNKKKKKLKLKHVLKGFKAFLHPGLNLEIGYNHFLMDIVGAAVNWTAYHYVICPDSILSVCINLSLT